MLIKYEMRYRNVSPPDKWVEFCGRFPTQERFDHFRDREATYGREIRNVEILKEKE